MNIDSATNPANTIDFGSQATFNTNDVLIYEGTGSNPPISGLTVGDTYYVLVPDPTQPGVIQLTDSTGAVQPIGLSNGATTTTVNFITAEDGGRLDRGTIDSARVGNHALGRHLQRDGRPGRRRPSTSGSTPGSSRTSRWSTKDPPMEVRGSMA